jgi:hypothetical protein
MKRSMRIIISALVLSLALLSAAWAAETKEEQSLGKETAGINTAAQNEKGEKAVVQRLEKEFSAADAQIQALRNRKLGYGEIAVVFSLAQKMPGGINDANTQKILTMRQGPPTMGWGEIAKKLGAKLGPTISQVRKVNKDTDREMKHAAKDEKGGMEMHQERHDERHGEMTKHEGIGGGQGMSHVKGR